MKDERIARFESWVDGFRKTRGVDRGKAVALVFSLQPTEAARYFQWLVNKACWPEKLSVTDRAEVESRWQEIRGVLGLDSLQAGVNILQEGHVVAALESIVERRFGNENE